MTCRPIRLIDLREAAEGPEVVRAPGAAWELRSGCPSDATRGPTAPSGPNYQEEQAQLGRTVKFPTAKIDALLGLPSPGGADPGGMDQSKAESAVRAGTRRQPCRPVDVGRPAVT
jgi:hypothetical protein